VREKPLLPKQPYRASLPDFFAIKALQLNQVRTHPFRANLAALGAIPDDRQTFAAKYLHPPAIIQSPACIFYAGYGGGPKIIDTIPIGGEGIRNIYDSRCPRRRTIRENGKPVRGASILLLDEDAGAAGDIGIPDVNLGAGVRACQADAYPSIAARGQHIACQIDVGVFDEGTAQFYGRSGREDEREAIAHGWRACRPGCACPDENLPRCCARLKGYGIPGRPITLNGTSRTAVWLPQLSSETEMVVGTHAEPFHRRTSLGLLPERVPKTPLGSTVASLVPVPLYARTRKRPPSTSSRSVGVVVPIPKLPCAQRKCSPASHS